MSTLDLEKDPLKKAPSISIHVYKPGTLSFWKWLFSRKSKQGPLPVSKNYKFKLNADDLNAMRIKGFDLEKLKMSVENNEPHKNNQHKKNNMFIIPKDQLGLKENELLSDFVGSNIKRKTKHITRTTKIYKKSVSISTISISSKGSVLKESLEHIHQITSKKSLPRVSSKPSFCVGLKHKTAAKRLTNKGILSKSIPASVIEHNMQKKLFIPLHLGDHNTHKIIPFERKAQGGINTNCSNFQTNEKKTVTTDEHRTKMNPDEGQVPVRLDSRQEQDGTKENPAVDGDIVPKEKQLKTSPAIHCLVSEQKINKEPAKKYIVSYKVSQTKNVKKKRKLKRKPLDKTLFTITTIQNGKLINNSKNKGFVYAIPDLNDKTIGETQGESGDDKVQCDDDNNITKSLILKNNKADNHTVEESQNNLILELISMFKTTLEKDEASKQTVQNLQNLPLMVLSKPTFNWRHKSLISASESQYESEEVEQSLKLNKNEKSSTVDGQPHGNPCDRPSATDEGLKEESGIQNTTNKSKSNTIQHSLPSESGKMLRTSTNLPIKDTKDVKENLSGSGCPIYNNLKKNHVRLGHSISLPSNLLNEAVTPSKTKEDTDIITVTITVDNSSTDKVNIENNTTPPIQFKLVHNKVQRRLFLTSSENPGDLALEVNLINGRNPAYGNDDSKTIGLLETSEITHTIVNKSQTFTNQNIQEGNKSNEITSENVPFLQAKRCLSLTDHKSSINQTYQMNQNVSDHSIFQGSKNNFNQKKLFVSKHNNSVIQEHGLINECEPIYLDQRKRKEFEEKLLSAKRRNPENETGTKEQTTDRQTDKFGKGWLSLHSQASPSSLASQNTMKINRAKEHLTRNPEEYLNKHCPEMSSKTDYLIKVNSFMEKTNSTSIQSSNKVNINLKPNVSTSQLESHSMNLKNKIGNTPKYMDKQPFCVIKKEGTSNKSATNKLDGHKRSLSFGLTLHQTITEESEDEEKSVGDQSEQGDSHRVQEDRLDPECKTEESKIQRKDAAWVVKDDNENTVIASNFFLQPSMSIMQLSGPTKQSSKKAVSTSSQTDASMFSLLMSKDMLCEVCGRNKGTSDYDCQPNMKSKDILPFFKGNNNNQSQSHSMVNVYQEPQNQITINATEGLHKFTSPMLGNNSDMMCANGKTAHATDIHSCSHLCFPTFSDSDSNSTDFSDQNDESSIDNKITAITETLTNDNTENI